MKKETTTEAPKVKRTHPGGENVETRTFKIEYRNDDKGESRTVAGVAAVFESESNELGWFREKIMPGAFDDADMSDVRALFNHDPNQILARSKNNSLSLSITENGLEYSFDCPQTTCGNDCLENIRSGLIDQSSFAFTVSDYHWEEEKRDENHIDVRVITKIQKVYDVSPVTYPAYDDTSVAKRSFDKMKAEKRDNKENTESNVKTQADARDRRLRLIEAGI